MQEWSQPCLQIAVGQGKDHFLEGAQHPPRCLSVPVGVGGDLNHALSPEALLLPTFFFVSLTVVSFGLECLYWSGKTPKPKHFTR